VAERIQFLDDPVRPVRVIEDPDSIEDSTLAFFLDHWRTKCGSTGVPLRDAFGPREFGVRLPWLVLAEALPGLSDFRYRLIGSRVAEYFGADNTGKTVSEAFDASDLQVGQFIRWILRRTCTVRRPVRLTGPAFALRNVFCPDYDTLYLPFSTDGNSADLVLNAFVFNPTKIIGSRDVELVRLG
jgi:hypothetical protein